MIAPMNIPEIAAEPPLTEVFLVKLALAVKLLLLLLKPVMSAFIVLQVAVGYWFVFDDAAKTMTVTLTTKTNPISHCDL